MGELGGVPTGQRMPLPSSGFSEPAYGLSCSRVGHFVMRPRAGKVLRPARWEQVMGFGDHRHVLACRSARLATLPFGLDGCVVPNINWAGSRFQAIVDVNRAEVRRREQIGLGPVIDFETLDAVATLPLGIPVPWSAIDPVLAAVLDCVHPGVARRTPADVTRVLAQPLRLIAILKVVDHWRASRTLRVFARHSPTLVVARHRPRALADAVDYAQRSGVGLAVLQGDRPEDLVAPATHAVPSLARDRLIEVVFRAWVRHGIGTPANRSHALS